MFNQMTGQLPDELSDALKEATADVARRFVQSCLDDPLFEFGLLAMTFMPPESEWRNGEPWGARHWSGQRRVVRAADVPHNLPLAQFAAARPSFAEWNAAVWLVGLKPDGTGAVLRTYTESAPDPLKPLQDGDWATNVIADFANDLLSVGNR